MLVWSSPITAQTCSGTGFSCSVDCRTIFNCVNGILLSAECPAGSFCNQAAGDCSASTCDITCTTTAFECTDAVTFPDPYSCSNFILCPTKGGTPTNISCPSNTVFEPCTATCSPSFPCTTPRIRCTSDFDMGSVPGNAEMFYTCNLATSCDPVIRKCNDGYIYDSVGRRCTPVGYDVCQQQPYTCIDQGFHPEPLNCTVYYYCDPNLQLTIHSCKPGYHYVQSAEGCLSGAC